VKGTGEGGVCLFFWVMSVLLSLARGIKDARLAEEWEIKLKLGWTISSQSFFQPVGQNHVVHLQPFSFLSINTSCCGLSIHSKTVVVLHCRQQACRRNRSLFILPAWPSAAVAWSCYQLGLSISGSVWFWTKINNQIKLFFFNFLNRTKSKTGSNQLISVRFGSVFPFPNRFKPNGPLYFSCNLIQQIPSC